MERRKTKRSNDALQVREFVDDLEQYFIVIWFERHGKARELGYVIEPRSAVSDVAILHKALLDRGANLPFDRSEGISVIKKALADTDVRLGRLVRRPGWHGRTFIRGDTPAPAPSAKVLLRPKIAKEARDVVRTRGSLDEWKSSVGELARQSTYVAFAIAHALAAPLARRVRGIYEGAVFNFTGASSTGKTSAIRACLSTYGYVTDLPGWNETTLALSQRASLMSDMPLILDDMKNMRVNGGQRRSQRIRDSVHLLAGGRSTRYSAEVRANLEDLDWFAFAISANTISTADEYRAENAGDRDLSERVRLIDIPIPTAEEGGIWDRRNSSRTPAQLSEDLAKACRRSHGEVMKSWLDHIAAEGQPLIAALQRKVRYFLKKVGNPEGAERRVARKFAAIYAAGSLAIEAGLVPWQKPFLFEVIEEVWRRSRDASLTAKSAKGELLEAIKAVQAAATSGRATYPKFEADEKPRFPADGLVAGFIIREEQRATTLCITTEHLATLVGAKVSHRVLDALKEVGAITLGSDGKVTRQVWITVGGDHKRSRFVHIDIAGLRALCRKLDASSDVIRALAA